jgi:hypothetical protein
MAHVQEIVYFDPETKGLKIHSEELNAILLKDDIQDLPVAVLCVAGKIILGFTSCALACIHIEQLFLFSCALSFQVFFGAGRAFC